MPKTITTREFEASHGRKPRGYGNWGFRNAAGDVQWITGTYTAAKAQLPAGTWTVLS